MAGSSNPIAVVNFPFSARELIAIYFGVGIRTVHRESTPSVGTAAAAVGQWNNVRTAVSLSNASANTIAVGFSSGITTASGFQLAPGQWITFSWFYDQELVMHQLWAIASAASSALYVLESVLSGA